MSHRGNFNKTHLSLFLSLTAGASAGRPRPEIGPYSDLARRTIGGSVIRRDSSVGLIDGRTSAFLNQV